MQYIHFMCLQQWLKTKEYQQQSTHYTSIYWRQFQCEICKSSLPYVLIHKKRRYKLINLPHIETDYLVLESLTLENKHSRMVHILHPNLESLQSNSKQYRLGRGQDCELKVSDISVSRNHCLINYKKGYFFLTDNGSKFGTLILARNRIEIRPNLDYGL